MPSTSSTTDPAPRAGTNGYARGSDGDVVRASRSRICRAFGPAAPTEPGGLDPLEAPGASLLDHRPGLLAQVLGHVVGPPPALPVDPDPFQPPNGWTPGQAPVVAPARRFT